jgi:hypothetical protein
MAVSTVLTWWTVTGDVVILASAAAVLAALRATVRR